MMDYKDQYAQLASAFNAGNWPAVLKLSMPLLQEVSGSGAVHYMAGIGFKEVGQFALALQHLRQAVALEPSRVHYLAQLANALSLAQQLDEARHCADHAVKLGPVDPVSFNAIGQVYTRLQLHSLATMAFRGSVALMPHEAAYRFNLGNALIAEGLLQEAEQQLQTCINLAPHYWPAYVSRSQLRHWSPDENHIEALSALVEAHRQDAIALGQLHMALAKECEDIGSYHDAFAHYTAGKTAAGSRRGYSTRFDKALFEAVIASVQSAQPNDAGHATEEPIFVIGMPRTGTTLLERIITSHPDAFSAGELQNFGMAIKRMSGSQTRAMLDLDTISSLGEIDWKGLGKSYLLSTRPATGKTRRFVDKLPHNFLYAGYMANALPNASIICVRRHPLETCLSNFRQAFSPESPYYDYSYNLLDTGRYYVLFDRLMAHWKAIFPGRILEVHYESLIEKQEETTRIVLAHCGLAWNPTCLQFHENSAPVATASAVQVREPIYLTSLCRRRHYPSELAELESLLLGEDVDLGER